MTAGDRPPLVECKYMNEVATEELQAFKAAFFRALAHPVRIRILELLVKGEKNVLELQETLGVDQPVVSQQLAVLRANRIVTIRKEGVTVRYTVRDPLIAELLDTARRYVGDVRQSSAIAPRWVRDCRRSRSA